MEFMYVHEMLIWEKNLKREKKEGSYLRVTWWDMIFSFFVNSSIEKCFFIQILHAWAMHFIIISSLPLLITIIWFKKHHNNWYFIFYAGRMQKSGEVVEMKQTHKRNIQFFLNNFQLRKDLFSSEEASTHNYKITTYAKVTQLIKETSGTLMICRKFSFQVEKLLEFKSSWL